MYISRIVIDNFRNFASIDLSDLPESLVLVGENGTGKSNFLHALRLLLDPSLPDTARHLSADDFWDGLTAPFSGNVITVSVDLTGFDADVKAKALLDDYVVKQSPLIARLTYAYRPRQGVTAASAATEADYEPVSSGGSRDEPIRREVLRYVSLRVLPALRDAESDLASNRSPLRKLLGRLQIDPAHVAKVNDATAEASQALLADAGVAAVNKGITERMATMVGPAFSLTTKLGIAPTEADQLIRAIRLFIDDGAQRPVSRASLGSANVLYLALLLQLIGAQEDAGEVVTTLLGVEEPEAHLHPHVQRVLFRHLLSGRRPIIVSTHSPHLASVAPLTSLTVLRHVGDQTKAYHARDVSFDRATVDDLQRYLDITRAEILFGKGVILVEGAAEEFIVPAFATNAGVDLDTCGVSVCSVRGTDFLPYRRLMDSTHGLAIPNVVITDGDPDAAGVCAGVTRARKLVSQATRARIDDARSNDDEALARHRAQEDLVFVGPTTLELDLLPTARDAMCQSWAELNPGAVSRRNFDVAVDGYVDGDIEQADEILARITSIGKGRYAQRLAGHLEGVEPPEHIAAALDAVRGWSLA